MAQNRAVSEKAEQLKLSDARIQFYKTDSVICANRTAISKLTSKLAMQKEISKKPAEASLPVILQILLEVKSRLVGQGVVVGSAQNNNNVAALPSLSEEIVKTLAVIDNTTTILGETDRVQRGSLGEKKAYIKKLLDDAKLTGENPFVELENMVKDVDNLSMTDETVKLWAELSIWLEGLYQKTAKNIKQRDANNEPMRDKKGCYPTVDTEDFGIWFLFSITKMDISIHYHRASVKLDAIIAQFKPGRKPSRPTMEAVAQDALATEAEDGAVVDGSIDYKMEVKPSSSKGFITLQIEIPETSAEYGQVICETVQSMFADPLAHELRKDVGKSDDARISNLESLLTQYGLSQMQAVNLVNFREDAKSVLNGYTDPNTLGWANPMRLFGRSAPLPGFLDHVNAPLADEAISDLNCSTDVTEHFKIIINLRRQLKETNSTNLRPAITKLMIDAIERICPDVVPLQREYSVPDLSKTVFRMK